MTATPQPKDDRYYIVRVKLLNVGPFAERRDTRWSYLAYDASYPSHSDMVEGAARFKALPTPGGIAMFDGRPWYDQHDPEAAPEIYKIVERRFVERL